MKKSARILFSIALLLLFYNLAHSTALSTLAASMNAGEWKELTGQNIGGDFLNKNVNGEFWYADMATTWTNYLCWNPASKEIFWVGAPHLGPFAFLRYSESANQWESQTNVPDCMRLPGYTGCFNHGYDDGSIDPVDGIMYYHSETTCFSYEISTKTWKQWTQSELYSTRADAMTYFPPLNKLAEILNGQLNLIDPVTHVAQVAASGLSMAIWNMSMEYSAVQRKLYFGGTSGGFYSMDSAKKVTRLADAPESYTCIDASLTCDPVTGNALLLANSNNYYEYRASANQWTKITSPPVSLNGCSGCATAAMATAIPEYGVVFYMSPNLKKVYLYKHVAVNAANVRFPAFSRGREDKAGPARVTVYDCKGRKKGSFSLASGFNSRMLFDKNINTGVYFVRYSNNGAESTRRLTCFK